MITLAINWGYALLVTGVGMVTVFLLLILLIWIINLQTKLTNQVEDHAKTVQDTEKAVVTTDTIRHLTNKLPSPWLCIYISTLMTRNLT